MKIQIIILLIILSFIAPSFHFIEHNHNYNPFTHALEHKQNNVENKSNNNKQNTEIKSLLEAHSELDTCNITFISEADKENSYSLFVKSKIVNKYVYSSNILIKIIKSNKVIFIAPKHSPPIA